MNRLTQVLREGRLLVLPGAANALTAQIIEDTGFKAAYITGAGIANTYLGVPDVGILGLAQIADHVEATASVVNIPLVVDADTGFGNAASIGYTIRVLENAGASAVQIEDQTFPKRCGHFAGKDAIPSSEMVDKIHAAVDARTSNHLLVIARTDARATCGLSEACARANAYRAAGADMVFVEAPASVSEIRTIAREVQAPQVINMVNGGITPHLSLPQLDQMGFKVALFANLALLASVGAMQQVLGDLHEGGVLTDTSEALCASWSERQRLVRLEEFMDRERKYS